MDIFDIVIRLDGQDGIRIDLPLVDPADNRAPIDPTLIEQKRIGASAAERSRRTRCLGTAGLPLVGKKLTLRESRRYFRVEPIGNGLEVEILPIIDLVANIEVECLGAEIALTNIAVFL